MNHPLRFLAGALLALSLVACHQPASAPQGKAAQPRQLKLYSVPPQQSSVLLHALRHTSLGKGSNVTQPFPGKLLVSAPQAEQASIGKAIAALSKAANTDFQPERLHVHFWLVEAHPGSGEEPAVLKPLSTTLNTLQKSLGRSHFSLQDSAMATVTPGSGYSSITTGQMHDFMFLLAPAGAHDVTLQLSYKDHTGPGFRKLDTSATLKLGQYMVLAQAPNGKPRKVSLPGLPGNPAGTEVHTPTVMRLLIVRVDRAGKTAH